MLDGYKIFDADAHVGPTMDVLQAYMSERDIARLEPFAEYRRVTRFPMGTWVTYMMGQRSYERRLGQAPDDDTPLDGEYMKGIVPRHRRPPEQDTDKDAAARIRDMDIEGVDVNLLLPSGWFGTWSTVDDLDLESAALRAYNDWMREYCAQFPERLTGVVLVSGRQVDRAIAEIERYGNDRWPMGVFVYAPSGMPLDHPSLDRIWAAAQDWDMAVVLHTFTAMPPYAPGGLDTWDNLFLQRSAAHPWCGMRNMAAILGGGVLDRFPKLRVGLLEAGQGWLPFWIRRLDEHVHSAGASLPRLEMLPSEYVMSGRYFQSIEISEGADVTASVADYVGDDVLVYASDYPHGESWFPESTSAVMGWGWDPDRLRKLLWDNPVRLYARYEANVAAQPAV